MRFILFSACIYGSMLSARPSAPEPIRNRVLINVNSEDSFRFAFGELEVDERLKRINEINLNMAALLSTSGADYRAIGSIFYPPFSWGSDFSSQNLSKDTARQYERIFWYTNYIKINGYDEMLQVMAKKLDLMLSEKQNLEASFNSGYDVNDELLSLEVGLQKYLSKVNGYGTTLNKMFKLFYKIQTDTELRPVNGFITKKVYEHSAPELQEKPQLTNYNTASIKAIAREEFKAYEFWKRARSNVWTWVVPQQLIFPLGPNMTNLSTMEVNRESGEVLDNLERSFEYSMDTWIQTTNNRLIYSYESWKSSKIRLDSYEKLFAARKPLRDGNLLESISYFKVGYDYYDAKISEALYRTQYHTLKANLNAVIGQSPIRRWR